MAVEDVICTVIFNYEMKLLQNFDRDSLNIA